MIIIKSTLYEGKTTDILIEDDRISRVAADIDVSAYPGAKIIDGLSTAAVPSFVNGHTHTPMTLLRGYGDDMLLDQWLNEIIWPVESKLNPEDYYCGYRLGLLEMVKTGTGFFNDMYMRPEIALNVLEQFGIKAFINYPVMDGNSEDIARLQAGYCSEFFNNTKVPAGVRLGVAAHSVGANSDYSLNWIRDFAAERDLPVHIHLSETKEDVERCRAEKSGQSPVEFLDSIGFLNDRVLAAHAVWVSEHDMDILAERKVTVIHNPVSNMKLAVGRTFPFAGFKERGVPMLLGTDGAASNNNLDMFEQMKVAALLQKHESGDPSLMTAEEIFSIATGQESDIIEGAEADIMLVDTNLAEMTPLTNLYSNLVYSANGSAVKTLISGGEIVMENRFVAEDEEILAEAAERAAVILKKNR